jgi:hypothetical protein
MMICIKLHCQKFFKLKLFSYKITSHVIRRIDLGLRLAQEAVAVMPASTPHQPSGLKQCAILDLLPTVDLCTKIGTSQVVEIRIRISVKANPTSENRRFGLSVRVGGQHQVELGCCPCLGPPAR